MGEIADGILNGDFDEHTGEWLGEGQGFPRHRGGSAKGSTAIYGVKNYLHKKGFIGTDELVIRDYIKEKYNISDLTKGCEKIQKEFGLFVNYVTKLKTSLNEQNINKNPKAGA